MTKTKANMTFWMMTGAMMMVLSVSRGQSDDPFIDHLKASLKQYDTDYRMERAYLSTDRFVYKPGEDLWFKAFVSSSGEQPDKPLSEDIFIRLLNGKGEEIISRRYPLSENQTTGRFLIPRTFIPGRYSLIAYTSWMKNRCPQEAFRKEILISKYFDKRFQVEPYFDKPAYYAHDSLHLIIRILDQTGKPIPEMDYEYVIGTVSGKEIKGTGQTDIRGMSSIHCVVPESDEMLMMTIEIRSRKLSGDFTLVIPSFTSVPVVTFFPEGGGLVKGLKSVMAFRTAGIFGQPLPVQGEIIDKQGNVLLAVTSNKDGIGIFDHNPGDDTLYLRIAKPAGVTSDYPLPMARNGGCVIHCEKQTADTVHFSIHSAEEGALSTTYWVASMDHRIIWGEVITFSGHSKIKIPVGNLPEGVLQVSVFDQKHTLVAERLVKLVNPARQLVVKTDHKSYQNRQRVNLLIESPLKIKILNLAVMVSLRQLSTHPLMNNMSDGFHHIPCDTLIHFKPSHTLENELVLLTTQYRDIYWTDVLQKPVPYPVYTAKNGIEGLVYDKKENLARHAKVRITHVPNYKSYETQTDETGTFQVSFGSDIIDFNFLNIDAYDALGKVSLSASIDQEYFGKLRAIIVEESENRYLQKFMDVLSYGEPDLIYALRYGPGKFRKSAPEARKKYDPNQYAGYENVLDILQDIKPYSIVDNTIVFTGEDVSAPRLGMQEGTVIVINGSLKGNKIDILENLLPSDITNISISTSMLDVHKYTPINFQGVIEITTIQSMYKYRPPTVQLGMDILNTNRKFYSPDYSVESTTSSDNRKTLYWNAQVRIPPGQSRLLTFYTSDIKGTFSGKVEGVDEDGNPVSADFSFVVE